jgi:hypothetical protein
VLRDNPLEAHIARDLEQNVTAIALLILGDKDSSTESARSCVESGFADGERRRTEILAFAAKQVESVEHGAFVVLARGKLSPSYSRRG